MTGGFSTPPDRVGVSTAVQIILWTRRQNRTLVQCELIYGKKFHEIMRRGLVGIVGIEKIRGRDEPIRYVDITPRGYTYLSEFGPKEYR